MFHRSDMGSFGGHLPCDLNGFVPEKGDKPEDFKFGHDTFTVDFDEWGNGYRGYAKEQWEAFVASAVKEAEIASDALEEWRSL